MKKLKYSLVILSLLFSFCFANVAYAAEETLEIGNEEFSISYSGSSQGSINLIGTASTKGGIRPSDNKTLPEYTKGQAYLVTLPGDAEVKGFIAKKADRKVTYQNASNQGKATTKISYAQTKENYYQNNAFQNVVSTNDTYIGESVTINGEIPKRNVAGFYAFISPIDSQKNYLTNEEFIVVIVQLDTSASAHQTISFGKASGQANTEVGLPLDLKNATGITELSATLEYDHSALTLVDVDSSKLDCENDVITLDGSVTEDVSLGNLKFKLNENAEPGKYPVTLKDVTVKDAEGNSVDCEITAGEITVEEPYYTASFTKNGATEVGSGDAVALELAISSSNVNRLNSYSSFEAEVSYDFNQLTLDKEAAEKAGYSISDEKGYSFTISGSGEAKSFDTVISIPFTAWKLGTGEREFKITSLKVDGKTVDPKNITNNVSLNVKYYPVTKAEGVIGEDKTETDSYTFRYEEPEKYDYTGLEVRSYGVVVMPEKNEDGSFIVEQLQGPVVIKVNREINADYAAANVVAEQIEALGDVTLDSKDAIEAARAAYEALTAVQKNKLDGSVLTALETAEGTYKELKEADDKAKADTEAAQAVIDQINAIGEVSLDSKEAIDAARAAYEALTEDQKAKVSDEALKALTAAEQTYEEVKKADDDKKADEARPVNTITASSLKKVYSTSAKQYQIAASAKDNAKLSFVSDNSKVKVNNAGLVTVPAKFIGKVTITIKAAETKNYKAASKEITITVNPVKTKLVSVKNVASKKIAVKWSKKSSVTGYQIQYSTSKKFAKGNKILTVGKKSAYKATIKKSLKKGKAYYVRVRTYKKTASGKYYSAWSKAKAVRITK